jgi:hypothetical protein
MPAHPLGRALADRVQIEEGGARLTTAMRRFWPPFEERAGFGRQWTTSVQRIRDHLAMTTVQRLNAEGAGA